jgi:hypothetical protein
VSRAQHALASLLVALLVAGCFLLPARADFGPAQGGGGGGGGGAIDGTAGQWEVEVDGDLSSIAGSGVIRSAGVSGLAMTASGEGAPITLTAEGDLTLSSNGNVVVDTNVVVGNATLATNSLTGGSTFTVAGPQVNLTSDAHTWSVLEQGGLQSTEISDPAAPAANAGKIYFRDNGSGKTQLVVRFATGAVQVIATEP